MSDSEAEIVVEDELPSVTVDGQDALKLIAEVHVLAESLIEAGAITREGFRMGVPKTADDLVMLALASLQALNVRLSIDENVDMRKQVAWRLQFIGAFDQSLSDDEEE